MPSGGRSGPCSASTTTPSLPTTRWSLAVATRGGQVPGVIMHTDRGSEYTAALVRQACARRGICQSIGPTRLRAGHDVISGLRAGTAGRQGGLRCPRFPVARSAPVLGPGITWQLTGSKDRHDQPDQRSTLSREPVPCV